MIFQKTKTLLGPILELLRWNKPSGRLILLIPAGWSLWLTPNDNPEYLIVSKIIIGGLLVSGLGCIANDIWDKEIDKKVFRTKNRPLASNKLSLFSAYLLLLIFSVGSLILTLSLPSEGRMLTLSLAILAFPLILIYPSAKRWFKFPQVILSICWGFSVLIPWAAHENNLRSPVLFFCWLGTILWTFGFDTVYSLADKRDDLALGINSSSINLKKYTKFTIHSCYLLTSICLAICAILARLNFFFWPFWLIISFFMQKDVKKVFDLKDKSIMVIGMHFQRQVIYGSLFLISIIISK